MSPHRHHDDDPVAAVVRVLVAFLDVTQQDVSTAIGMPHRTFMRRMGHGGWSVAEVRQLAGYFHVPVSRLLDGPAPLRATLFGEARNRRADDRRYA